MLELALKGCIAVLQGYGQFRRSEHGGLELHGGLGTAYCSGTLKGELGSRGEAAGSKTWEESRGSSGEPCGRAVGSHGGV